MNDIDERIQRLKEYKKRVEKAVHRLAEYARYTGDDAQDFNPEQDAEDVLTFILGAKHD